MVIDAIKNGIVIDHITAGKAMELYRILGLGKLDCTVAILKNVVSAKHGRKDIIKIDQIMELDWDVIGYVGRTGYSATENVNNIEVYHLHVGMQLIFDESQREGDNEIWIDMYALTQFLDQHRSEVVRNPETKEWTRRYPMKDPLTEALSGDLE